MASTAEGNLMGDWAELLPDLLILIAKHIHLYEDFVSFGGVCRSWRSVAIKDNFNHSNTSSSSRVHQIPWLLLAKKDGYGYHQGFASLSKGGMVNWVYQATGKHDHRVIASSMGWLITSDRRENLKLLHPLSHRQIPLPRPRPHRSTCPSNRRAVLSASPSYTDDYVVMVIIDARLYFWKPGNEVWNKVSLPGNCCAVIYYNDEFYAINTDLELFRCDTNSCSAHVVGHASPYILAMHGETYLVESAGELLVVFKDIIYHGHRTTSASCYFRVYKYFDSADMTTNKWDGINSLGGATIFVDRNAAIAVPRTAKIKPNCIYFTDWRLDFRNMGIYNLERGTIEPIPKVISPYCSPMWVIPSFDL